MPGERSAPISPILAGERSAPIWLTLLAIAALAITAAWLAVDALAPRRLATIDEGQWLYYASALRGGGVPYRDFWIQFGPLVLYSIGAAWAAFSETLATARWTIWGLNGLSLVAAGCGVALLTRSWRWAAVAVLLLESNAIICRALMLNPAFLARQCLPLLAIGLAARGWRSGATAPFVAAGAVSALAVLTSQEVGLFGLAALGGAAAAARLRGHDDWRPVAGLVAGAAGPMLMWGAAAIAMGGFVDYLEVSLLDTFAMVSTHQHQPLPGLFDIAAESFRDRAGWMLAYLPFGVWALAAGPVWRAWGRGDRAAAALWVFAVLLWTVNLGRSDRAHAAYAAGPSLALGVAALAMCRAEEARRRVAALGLAALLAVLWVASFDRQALLLSIAFEREAQFTSDFPRSGGAAIRTPHAARLRRLQAALDETTVRGDAIFVTPHDPALYFLLDRANPTAFATPVFANRDRDRRAIADDLLGRRPAVIVRTREGLLPGIDYEYYLELLGPVFDDYCRHPGFRGPVELWLRSDAHGAKCGAASGPGV